MEKGMLRKRLKGLLAFSLAFYLMFGNGIQVLAEEYDIATIPTTTIINPGDTIKYYYEVGSGAVTSESKIKINGNLQTLSMDVTLSGGQKEGVYQVSERLEVLAEAGDKYGTLQLGPVQKFDIVANPDLVQAGSVTGDGTYERGTQVTVTATPNSGYQFSHWKENGQIVSKDTNYTFTVNGERELVGVFEQRNNSGNSPSQGESVPEKPIVPEDEPQTQGPGSQTPERQEAPVSSSTGGSHIHTLKWEIVIEPTETTDGRSEYRCECGHVEAAQPISFFRVIIMRIIKAIEEAPQNGTVVVDNKFLRCLTDEIVAALHKRSDVNLEVRFVEQEVNYRFLIPAGRAPMEEEEWFGYFYLGGRYGWIQ